jgi:hypothetical protein
LFKEAVDTWHIAYLEAKLPNITPDKFLKMVDDKIQILKHADQWKESDNHDIMALKLELQKQKQESDIIMKNLVAHVSRFSNMPWFHNNSTAGYKHPLTGNTHDAPTHTPTYPPWMTVPPQHPSETKLVDHRLYTWCTKCRQGQGLWVCRHNTDMHVDGYNQQRNQRRRMNRDTMCSNNNYPTQTIGHRSDSLPHDRVPAGPVAQLSLLDYLDQYLPENESQFMDPDAEP